MRKALLLGFACLALAAPGTAPAVDPPAFEGELLALSDVDMPASGYADGALEPLPGARDTLARVDRGAVRSQAHASNSVISWPQVTAVSADGRFAYVAETRGAAPAGVAKLENVSADFPRGALLQAYALEGGAVRRIAAVAGGANPQSLTLSPDGRWLVMVTEPQRAEVFRLDDGRPTPARVLAIPAATRPDDVEKLTRTMAWSPRGDVLAANIANHRIQFFALERDAGGVPSALRPVGQPVETGRRLTLVRWTADGRFVLTTDTNGGGSALRALFQPAGRVVAVAYDAQGRHRVASSVTTGVSVESFAISPDERRLVAVNIERTFLPELWFLNLWPGRNHYSLNLLDFDPATGALTRVGGKVRAPGLLPEDAVFDRTGRNVAVAVFHRRKGPGRKQGFIDYFTLRDDGGRPRLVAQRASTPLARGAHDLELIP